MSDPANSQPLPIATLRNGEWYLLVISGLIGMGVGVVVLVDPSRSLPTLAVILGVYLLVAGVFVMVRTVSDRERSATGLLLGILTLIAGVVVIRHPGQSIVAVALALGLYFIVTGALDLAQAITGPRRLVHLAAQWCCSRRGSRSRRRRRSGSRPSLSSRASHSAWRGRPRSPRVWCCGRSRAPTAHPFGDRRRPGWGSLVKNRTTITMLAVASPGRTRASRSQGRGVRARSPPLVPS